MSAMEPRQSNQREAILGAIRHGLRRGALPADQAAMLRGRMIAHPRQIIPARTALDHAGLIALFTENAIREFCTVARIATRADLPGAVADYARAQNLPMRAVVAPHPALQAIDWAHAMLEMRFGRAEPSDLISIQEGFAGIAETGTLLLSSGATTPTTLNLLPDTAIVALDVARLVGPYEDAFDALRAAGAMPRNVMLVTGPSRSADIERTLELGAHGPRRLHIVLIGDDAAAATG
ncbi:MAG TPA: lactate utilization protein [Acidiphilium sp.]|nr:lactate utilization protein [Acidiphilium sp.]HQU24771.1 lactate utilization protein [Acidiphilium sp.]